MCNLVANCRDTFFPWFLPVGKKLAEKITSRWDFKIMSGEKISFRRLVPVGPEWGGAVRYEVNTGVAPKRQEQGRHIVCPALVN